VEWPNATVLVLTNLFCFEIIHLLDRVIAQGVEVTKAMWESWHTHRMMKWKNLFLLNQFKLYSKCHLPLWPGPKDQI